LSVAGQGLAPINAAMTFRKLLLAACLLPPAWACAQTQPPAAPASPASQAASAPAAGQAAAAPVLTFAQVMQAARDTMDVAIARRAVAGARADIATANHAPAPVLTTKASSIDLQHGVGGGNVLRDKRIDKSLGLDWTLERGDKRALRTRAAERTADAAASDLDEVVVQQQIAAAGAYWDLAAAQERVLQVTDIGKSAADLAAASARRQRAGDISQQESLRTEIEARRAQADVRSAQADRLRAMLALGQLIGQRGEFAVEAQWPSVSAEPPALPDIEQRADVRAAVLRVQAAQAAFDNALALRRNDVTVGTSYDHYPGTSTRLVELRLSMPLAGVLGSYNYEGEIGRARAGLDQAQDQLEKTRRAALAETGRLGEDVRAAAARAADFEQAIVPRARQVAAMAELAYTKGALPLVDLIDARRTLRSVLLDDIAARADHARAQAAWQLRQAGTTP
jgi:outer membrane protein, heavy metal efflux system